MHIKWAVLGLVSTQELTEKQILKQQKKLKKKAEKQKLQNESGPSRPKIEEIGSAFGDPHFHIESPTEPDLCFDIDGENGEIFKAGFNREKNAKMLMLQVKTFESFSRDQNLI